MKRWLREDTRARRLVLALILYVAATAVFFAVASRARITAHTPWNHFALLAEAWLDGRLDLGGPPPSYAGNNDFAKYGDKWFITFPAFPAVLILPMVKLGGAATKVQDGQFFLWLAGIAPAVLFLVFEKLRRSGRSGRDVRTNFVLALLFAFGTVYFFTAEQGTVWFAAHVVAAGLLALYLLFALDAERPWLAGLMIGLGFMTRAPLLFAAPLFLYESVRVSLRPLEAPSLSPDPEAEGAEAEGASREEPGGPGVVARARDVWARLDKGKLFGLLTAFAIPVIAVVAVAMWHNKLRFGNPFDFGYSHLQIAWRGRVDRWGLFHYHYLPKNLGVILTSLPWVTKPGAAVPFQINAHGLALWFTTPIFLWLLWPKRAGGLHAALWLSVVAVAAPTLLYHNTGWVQFGYRFSNDYAPLLFVLLAIGGRRFGKLFFLAATWSVAVNAFGAATFDRAKFKKYYYQDNSQRVFYQPD